MDKKRRRTLIGEQDTASRSGQEETYTHGRADGCHHRDTWRNTLLGSRALPPGCTELSEEHILLGEQIVPSKSFWNMLDTLGGNILVYKDQLP